MLGLKRSRSSKTAKYEEPKLKFFVARVQIINGPDEDQQPILHHIISATDEKEARHEAEEYFLDQYEGTEMQEEGKTLRETMEDSDSGGGYGPIPDMQSAWSEIKITPLKNWLETLQGDWIDLNRLNN